MRAPGTTERPGGQLRRGSESGLPAPIALRRLAAGGDERGLDHGQRPATSGRSTVALWGEISVKAGRIEQSNFHDYRMARLADVPPIDVRVVGGNGPPGGVGEASVPVVAPALANAVFAAAGVRRRRLPLVAPTTTDSR